MGDFWRFCWHTITRDGGYKHSCGQPATTERTVKPTVKIENGERKVIPGYKLGLCDAHAAIFDEEQALRESCRES